MTGKTKPNRPASGNRRDFVKKLGTGTAAGQDHLNSIDIRELYDLMAL